MKRPAESLGPPGAFNPNGTAEASGESDSDFDDYNCARSSPFGTTEASGDDDDDSNVEPTLVGNYFESRSHVWISNSEPLLSISTNASSPSGLATASSALPESLPEKDLQQQQAKQE